jgi:hypothetical protein
VATRRSHQLVKICDVFSYFLRCTLCMRHAHWTSFNCKDDAPDAVVNVRLYSLVLDSCMLNCFCKPALGSQVSASQQPGSWCHVPISNYPHQKLVFDFSPRWKSFTWPGFQV